MKYIKEHIQNVDKYSYLTPLYEKLITELGTYKEFLKKMGFNLVSIVFEVNFSKFIETNCVTTLLYSDSDQKRKIAIKIDKDSILVHHYNLYNEEQEKKERYYNVYNTLHYEREGDSLLNLFKNSKEKGYKPILYVYQSLQKSTFEELIKQEGRTNILDNIFFDSYKYMREYTIEQYHKMIPYFIYFGTNDSIKNWWERIKNTKDVYEVSAVIKKSDQYSKFTSIIGDNIVNAGEMHDIGFADD